MRPGILFRFDILFPFSAVSFHPFFRYPYGLMAIRQLILIGSFFFFSAQGFLGQGKDSDKEARNPLGLDKAAVAAGGESFQSGCGSCHGSKGQGGRGPKLADNPRLREKSDKKIFDIIKIGVPGSVMPPSALDETQVWQLVSFVRSSNANAAEQHVPGDVSAGESLFFGAKKCSQCHMIRGRGGLIGPDLSTIGGNRSVEKITESIKDPSLVVEPGFSAVAVVTRDGRRISGVAKNNSNFSIQILDGTGTYHLLLKKDLVEVIHHQDSLMPQIDLTESELQNLLAFLSRQTLGMPAEKIKTFEHGKEKEP
jgi:cytochrome c oxidase cbb3-type subunit 3